MTLEEQIRQVRELRADYEEKRRLMDDAEMLFKKARLELWERMDATGVTSIGIDGKMASRKSTIYGSVSDKQELYRWAVDEENAPELFAPEPRKGLINERVRQMIDNGEELPPGLNFYVDKYISDTKQ